MLLNSGSKLPVPSSRKAVNFASTVKNGPSLFSVCSEQVEEEEICISWPREKDENEDLLSEGMRKSPSIQHPDSKTAKAQKLKRRSIKVLNEDKSRRIQTRNPPSLPAPSSTVSVSSCRNIPQPSPASSSITVPKFGSVRSSGYGKQATITPSAGPSRGVLGRPPHSGWKRPANVNFDRPPAVSTGRESSASFFTTRNNRQGPAGKRARLSDKGGSTEDLKEHIKGIEDRLVKVEMSGAAVPAGAARHLSQAAHDNLMSRIQNLENSIQQKDMEILGKDAQISLKEARNRELESKVEELQEKLEQKTRESQARKEMLEEVSMSSEKLKAQMSIFETNLTLAKNELASKEEAIGARERKIEHLLGEIAEQKGQLRKYEWRHREAHETIQDLKNAMGSSSSSTNAGKIAGKWQLDKIFGPKTTQEELFTELSELVQSALHGYNVSVFAYGQTGSGKTYTMEGGPEPEVTVSDPKSEGAGIIPRAVLLLFRAKEELEKLDWKYQFKVSFLEIYNEELRDLLASAGRESEFRGTKSGKLEISVSGKGVKVAGLTRTEVKSPEEVLGLMAEALKRRSVGATKCNERSSRSHALFQLYVDAQSDKGENSESVLSLVDLAGSERLKESESVGLRLTEAQHINSSLSTLKMVIRNQAAKKGAKGGTKEGHVPFRDSKLTILLKNSLGGGSSKTLMLTTVSPAWENGEEAKRTLDFAVEASQCYIGVASKQGGKK